MQPKEMLLYYTAAFFLAALLIMRRKPRKGMLLKLRGKGGPKEAGGRGSSMPGPEQLRGTQAFPSVTPISAEERPLNVIFNYNGESWDAYEVLGLPAGSSLERAAAALQESLQRVDSGVRPFMEAAFAAIKTQWESHKVSKGS